MQRCLSNPKPLEQMNTAADSPDYDKIIEAWHRHEDEMVRQCRQWGVAPD